MRVEPIDRSDDPKLDAEIATEVMEWHSHKGLLWLDADDKETGYSLEEWHPSAFRSAPHYWRPSIDIAQAWLVLERMADAGWNVVIDINAGGGFVSMTKFNERHNQVLSVATGETPRSICLTARDAKAAA